ncbi:MAG: Fe-S oxidoreductase [uncultured Nocardioidaceae bacterium]|uniref:Fe-S oxidoreductase n=1 Tax=uncultured Nocardioidaceae bacterium TaxID=253824 RepID=A0A6J4KXU6_9ACTN|nr:MAG: Fe-S oxidoreductase [uncultured Nocardioidaceae bacterium]
MQVFQLIAIGVSLLVSVVAIALFVRAAARIVGVLRLGQPILGRRDSPGARWSMMARETLGHTRMLQWTLVGIAHWFVFVAFGALFFTLLTAYGQLFDAEFALPLIGHWIVYEWLSEAIAWLGLISILGLLGYRLTHRPAGELGRRSRFFGSRMWQAYYVELTILGIVVCVLLLRGLEYALGNGSALHFPLTFFLGEAFAGLSTGTLETLVHLLAMTKILISMAWFGVLAANLTMGVAWHRFTAWPNIWFKRHADGSTSLGDLPPMNVGGKALDFADLDDLDEDAALGVGKVEDFSWKGLLDFTTCTECGRCQSQCPAWNTEKPLSPKLLVMGLREHAYAKAPLLQADDPAKAPAAAVKEAERPLIGDEAAYGVIDPDVLWSCTSCGACVQQCPVDIEHVDHIVDMRRYQVLVESNFPAELNSLFKGLETKGNPWNMAQNARMDWAKNLPFEVKQVGSEVEDLTGVEYLFWVGCAGAYEDRAKKTTQAVAELLHTAGVDFAVLGDGETCSGDPARRAGNEFVFSMLAEQNAEVLREAKATKVVATCAHCFNTLKNEYSQLGVELDVVHHTQLLNRLVREGRLTPVAAEASVASRTITYHDPCYLGRHNKVYEPPRELLSVIPNTAFTEMPRNSERSFCCGAGGARMWMEEKIGQRINVNRTAEAVATGADQIAVGCPFCRVMLSDGLIAQQAQGEAREEVEVLDVAQMLLAAVKREPVASVAAEPSAQEAADPASVTATTAVGALAGTTPAETGGSEPQLAPHDQSPGPRQPAEQDEYAAAQGDDSATPGPVHSAHTPSSQATPWDGSPVDSDAAAPTQPDPEERPDTAR